MNQPKHPVHLSVKFKPGITVIRQLRINEYGFCQDFYGLIDDQGNELISCECQYFMPMGEGIIKTEDRLGNVGILDQAGNFVVPFSRGYQSISPFHDDRALVRSATLPLAYGFIDRQGNEVSPLKYANACNFQDGVAKVKTFDGLWGLVDPMGIQLTPFKYDDITHLHGGLMTVRIKRKYGIVSRVGVEMFPVKYSTGDLSWEFHKMVVGEEKAILLRALF